MLKYCLGVTLISLATVSPIWANGEVGSDNNITGVDPFWRGATVYFMMTDRFANGDLTNDGSVNRKRNADLLRGFEGGDIRGIIEKLNDGYFDTLGVNAIWTTPLIENVHGFVDEGEWGRTYAYHGYWPLDWSAVDPNFGTEAELAEMVDAAHRRGIKVIVDVIINHAGAPTSVDPVWPETWVRRAPACDYKSFAGTTSCELAFTLQDIKTESEDPVELPEFLLEKWRTEGRLEKELTELDVFFARTGYPRSPKYYIVKWLTDWVREYGVDGFRADTAKHVDPEIWGILKKEAEIALVEWRRGNSDRDHEDIPFYMVGEVFNYGLAGFANAVDGGRAYDYGDKKVDFFEHGFDALTNMGFPTHAQMDPQDLFELLGNELESGPYKGLATLNYISSHDDQEPFDPDRARAFESATKLMLSPGAAQIYYGDEIGRSLVIPKAKGDATLRSVFEWADISDARIVPLLSHWRKLGQFRKAHPAVGAGVHKQISSKPYAFSRILDENGISDRVIVVIDPEETEITLSVEEIFSDGTNLIDQYSGQKVQVYDGKVRLISDAPLILLAPAI